MQKKNFCRNLSLGIFLWMFFLNSLIRKETRFLVACTQLYESLYRSVISLFVAFFGSLKVEKKANLSIL